MITTIVFDLGSVLFYDDWPNHNAEKLQIFSDTFSMPPEDIKKAWEKLWPDLEVGKTSEEEFWSLFLNTDQASYIEQAKSLWRQFYSPVRNNLLVLDRLPHYRLVILSDIAKEWMEHVDFEHNLKDKFDLIIASGEVKMSKRAPEIFDYLLKKVDESPENILLIDDRERNCNFAKEKGINTIQYSTDQDLEKALLDYGIKLSGV